MNKILVLAIVVMVAASALAITTYLMVSGRGNCPCAFIHGSLTERYATPNQAEFVLNLSTPSMVQNPDYITIIVNMSGEKYLLKYNGTAHIWSYTGKTWRLEANIIDNNHNNCTDSGDYVIIKALNTTFHNGDSVEFVVIGYSKELQASITISKDSF